MNKQDEKKMESHPLERGRNDVVRLLEYSLQYNIENAFIRFPMFPHQKICDVYALSKSQRERLLADRVSQEEPPFDHRIVEQKEKLREMAKDPSNR